MVIHTIWGDFESEEELIRTGAKMMGISFNKAKRIRENALKEHEKERQREERINLEKQVLEKTILLRIKDRFPNLHFKECPWCHKAPELEVEVNREWKNGIKSNKFKDYDVKLKTCDHLYYNVRLNTYPIDKLPNAPTYPNPEYTWDGEWNSWRWKRSVKEYEEYLSPDYPRKCNECGIKWRGYDDYSVPELDGKCYCWKCFDAKYRVDENTADLSLYRDMLNLSTMHDNGPIFYTSLKEMLRCKEHDDSEIFTVHLDVGDDRRGSSKLSGDIRGDRWEIWLRKDPNMRSSYNWLGYVFEPKDVDELRKYLRTPGELKRELNLKAD